MYESAQDRASPSSYGDAVNGLISVILLSERFVVLVVVVILLISVISALWYSVGL